MMVRVLLLVSCILLACCSSSLALKLESMATRSCVNQGGVCLDIDTHKCSVGFKKGMCPGPADIQCCQGGYSTRARAPATPAQQPSLLDHVGGACSAAGGQCMDSIANSCSGGFRSGLCPGGAEVKCCMSGLQFSTLEQCYPQGSAEEVKARLGGAVNGEWITNTCAIRMSHTLNCAGKLVPSLGAETITGKAPTNWKYVFRVRQLSPLIMKMFGNGVTLKPKNVARGVDPSPIIGKKGIIYFDTTGAWNDATGHFDLWNNDRMVEAKHGDAATTQRYFSLSVGVTFWEFP